jgi:hypothetical protein
LADKEQGNLLETAQSRRKVENKHRVSVSYDVHMASNASVVVLQLKILPPGE